MVDENKYVVFLDTDTGFLSHVKDFSAKRGISIKTMTEMNELFELLDSDCSSINVLAINIDEYSLDQLVKLRDKINSSNCSNTRILSITGPKTKFSGVTVEKIKKLVPLDLINKSHDTEKMLFRITNALFYDSPKRRNPRIIIQLPVKCSFEGKEFDAKTFSLSRDGIFIETSQRFPKCAELHIIFRLPGIDKPYSLDCRVNYELRGDPLAYQVAPEGMGMVFLEVSDDQKKQLEQFIKDNQ